MKTRGRCVLDKQSGAAYLRLLNFAANVKLRPMVVTLDIYNGHTALVMEISSSLLLLPKASFGEIRSAGVYYPKWNAEDIAIYATIENSRRAPLGKVVFSEFAGDCGLHYASFVLSRSRENLLLVDLNVIVDVGDLFDLEPGGSDGDICARSVDVAWSEESNIYFLASHPLRVSWCSLVGGWRFFSLMPH
mmetsp:Transcript_48877/g.110785  ORF Transcript_48877/g.110785 Transcript_48877/m.110785 type:complete len:190 (+) Transcript_48877:305-874(+)